MARRTTTPGTKCLILCANDGTGSNTPGGTCYLKKLKQILLIGWTLQEVAAENTDNSMDSQAVAQWVRTSILPYASPAPRSPSYLYLTVAQHVYEATFRTACVNCW